MLWHVLVILFWCFSGPIFCDFWLHVGKAEFSKLSSRCGAVLILHSFAACLLGGVWLLTRLNFGKVLAATLGQDAAKLGQEGAKVGPSKGILRLCWGILCLYWGKWGKDLWQLEQDLIKEGCLDVVCWLLAD